MLATLIVDTPRWSAHTSHRSVGLVLPSRCRPPLLPSFNMSSPSVTLTTIHSDVWSCMLPFCSFTDLIRLSHIHPYLSTLSQQRAWSECIRRSHLQPRLTATQQTIIVDKNWTSQHLIDYLLPALARVETHLLHSHTIPPLHLTLLLQALLTAEPSSIASSSSSSSSSSLSHHHSLAHTGSYPSMQSYFLHYHRHPSDPPLPSPTSLHSLSLPSVCLWLSNPFAVPAWVHRFAMRKRTADAQDEVKDVVAQMDGRVVWIGSVQLRPHAVYGGGDGEAGGGGGVEVAAMPFAFGYWMGTVEEPRDKHAAVCMSSSTIADCQQRIHDPTIDWSTLPILVYRIHASTLEHVSHASYQSLRLFLCLADVLRLALPVGGGGVGGVVDEVLGCVGGSGGEGEIVRGQTLLLQQRIRPGAEGQMEWERHLAIAPAADSGTSYSSRPRRRWVA